MTKKIFSLIYEYWILILIFILSTIVTFLLFNSNIQLYSMEPTYIIPEIKSDFNDKDIYLTINTNEIDNVNEKSINNVKLTKNDYYKISDWIKTYIISDTQWSYNYWFITRKKVWDVTYLYSHNSYKYTENSWYYIYNNWKVWTKLLLDEDEYEIVWEELFDFNKWEYKEKMNKNISIVYFTCTPYWDNIRKVFFIKKV